MIAAAEFEYLRGFLRDQAAIILDVDKHYLAEARLAPLLAQEGFGSVQQLLAAVRRQPQSALHRKILDAMTNNETWFFRDWGPFESLRTNVLPDMIRKRCDKRQLTIWSAAASSGQEIYSIAMIIREYFPQLLRWDLKLLATDVSERILQRARHGIYSQLEVNRGLPARLLTKYFVARGGNWEIIPELRDLVVFHQMNLSSPWAGIAEVDIAFLRNVLIYFDLETKRGILRQMRRVLQPDGLLILGCAETTLNLDDSFERVQIGQSCWYQRRGDTSPPSG
jgi:chemotaxis protein methyltransferase CheR